MVYIHFHSRGIFIFVISLYLCVVNAGARALHQFSLNQYELQESDDLMRDTLGAGGVTDSGFGGYRFSRAGKKALQ